MAVLLNRYAKVIPENATYGNGMAVIEGIDEDGQQLLLRFDPPYVVEGRPYSYAVARPRLERDKILSLLAGSSLLSSVTWIPEEKFKKHQPFDLSWWRGGAATIADIVLANE